MSKPENTDETNLQQPEITFPSEDGTSSISPNSIEGIFLQALQKDNPADREAWLDDVCGEDQEQRLRVRALLRAYDDAGSFMETPASGSAANSEISLSFLKPIDKDGCLGTIGPYEVLEVIGRGGMGLVLRAVDLKLNRVVAVKVLIPELAANPSARRRFLREAQAAAAISHPHVVTIHAVEEASDGGENEKPTPPYLVMECVVGQSLQQKLDAVGPFQVPEIVRISRQISEGLAAAHRQGVIHRDIKPANILLENGVERVKITDFGLARAIDDITVTRTGEVSGTPQYMSPEQANGERVDHRSDLFSLGCVMYAMCTGHSPFRGDSIAHVIKRVTQDSPRPILEQNPEIPPWLIQIIDCLLEKSADKRFQSAEGVAVILEQHLARIQQPTESGSHTLINQQVPIAAAASAAAVAPVAGHVALTTNKIKVPNWLQSLGRILILVSIAVVAMMWWGSDRNVRIGAAESGFLFVIGGWPILMGAFLCRRQMTREALLAVLFLGLGPLGLVIYLFVSERLEPADPNDVPTPITRYQVGTWFLAAGALVVFCLLGWVVLVGFEILDASQAARANANTTTAVCLGIFAVLMMIGMLLRPEILGNESWTSFFKLGGWSLLGPLGIWYWMSVQQKTSPEREIAGATTSGPGSSAAPVHTATAQTDLAKGDEQPRADVQPETKASQALAKIRRQYPWGVLLCFAIGACTAAFLLPDSLIASAPVKAMYELFRYPLILFCMWIMQMLANLIFRKQIIPLRIWGMVTSVYFGTMAFGWYWCIAGRMSPTEFSNLTSQHTLILSAALPSMIWILYAIYVWRELPNSGTLKGVPESERRQAPGPNSSKRLSQ